MPYFIAAFLLSIVSTLSVKKIALSRGIVDRPDKERKKHKESIPLLGGTAVFLSFWLLTWLLYWQGKLAENVSLKQLIGIFIGSSVIIIFGFFDDKRGLNAILRLGLVIFAILIVLIAGVKLNALTNPFGGIIRLDKYNLRFWEVSLSVGYCIAFFWILGMSFTTKILDGLDGLAAGVALIASSVIYFLAHSQKFYQPDIALISLVLTGAIGGFLVFNFHPAKIFLGEGGSLFLGFILGVLSVIAGSKMATALLVMAVPVLDLGRVMINRFVKHKNIFEGDRQHLHFLLVDKGLNEKWAVLILYGAAFLFGISALFLRSYQKIIVLIVLSIITLVVGFVLNREAGS